MFLKRLSAICRTSLFVSMSLLLCHCSTVSNDRLLLTDAGFREKMPTTPKLVELYNATPAYKLQRVDVEGNALYAYKDTERGVAYVGEEAEYNKYQQLALQRQIAQDHLQPAQMQPNLATGWYGAYAPYEYGGPWRFLY